MITIIRMLPLMIILLFHPNTFQVSTDWVAPKSADEIINPLSGDAQAIVQGKQLFTNMCAVCHGNTGKGNGAAGVALKPKPADFLSAKIRKESDGALYWKLTQGKAPMASFQAALSDQQRWELINYIRELERKYKD